MNIVCAYYGNPADCPECGGSISSPGTRQDPFCDDDCAASYSDRAAAQDAAQQARRAREDAFGVEVDRLRGLGHGDVEIDVLLAGMPS